MLSPENLEDMEKYMTFQQELVLECAAKKKEIDMIHDNVLVMSK